MGVKGAASGSGWGMLKEYEGGAPIVMNNVRLQWVSFMPCQDMKNLSNTLGAWYELAANAGANIDEPTLRTLLVEILPPRLKHGCTTRMMLELCTRDGFFKLVNQQAAHLRPEQLVTMSPKRYIPSPAVSRTLCSSSLKRAE